MKRLILSIFLSISLLLVSVTGAVGETAAAPSVQIISIIEGENAVDVVFFCQNPGEGQIVTVLCEGQEDSRLYVGQWQDITQGINRKSFPIDAQAAQGSYVVTLGGENIANPSSFGFTFGSAASQGCMAIELDITCGGLLEQLGMTQDIAAITVDGNPLGLDELVPAGAILTLRMDSQEITSLLFVAGDVNSSRTIDASDALLALQHSVKLITLEQLGFCSADTNFNGTVDAMDALLILQYSVGLVQHF